MLTNQLKVITAVIDGNAKTMLNLLEVGIKRTAKYGELITVIGLQEDLVRFGILQIHDEFANLIPRIYLMRLFNQRSSKRIRQRFTDPNRYRPEISSSGTREWIRTTDTQFRRLVLYPAELHAHRDISASAVESMPTAPEGATCGGPAGAV